jgi:hypothetical protein
MKVYLVLEYAAYEGSHVINVYLNKETANQEARARANERLCDFRDSYKRSVDHVRVDEHEVIE